MTLLRNCAIDPQSDTDRKHISPSVKNLVARGRFVKFSVAKWERGGISSRAPLTVVARLALPNFVLNKLIGILIRMAEYVARSGIDSSIPLRSDKEFLTALQMTEPEAAVVLGRSRQSLYQARISERSDYFKRNDIISLVFSARSKRSSLDTSRIYEYIHRTRGDDVLSDIHSVGAHDAEEPRLIAYRQVWIVIPDLVYLEREYPDAMSMILRLARRADGFTRIFTSNGQEAELLKSSLNSNRVELVVEAWMGGIPFTIIGDPHGTADCYIFSDGRFIRHEWYGGPKLAMLLESLAGSGLVPKALQLDPKQDDARAIGG